MLWATLQNKVPCRRRELRHPGTRTHLVALQDVKHGGIQAVKVGTYILHWRRVHIINCRLPLQGGHADGSVQQAACEGSWGKRGAASRPGRARPPWHAQPARQRTDC